MVTASADVRPAELAAALRRVGVAGIDTATIGGATGNNACGSPALRYGPMPSLAAALARR